MVFYFTTLLNFTKDGIAFPRHVPPIVKYLPRRCAYGDTVLYTFICHVVDYKFSGFFCIIFVRLLNILNVPTGTHFARFFYTI